MKYLILGAFVLTVSCNSQEQASVDNNSPNVTDVNTIKHTCADGTVIEMKDSTWLTDGECDCPDCSDEQ